MPRQLTKILFLAYYFPPVGGAGVQRSVKFARYLPEEGFLPIVITGTGNDQGHWAPEDKALLGELPQDLPIYRPDTSPPSQSDIPLWKEFLGLRSSFAKWWHQAVVKSALRAAEGHDPRLIYVSLSPYETLAPALELAARLRLPVVADLRDPWALDEVRIYLSRVHRSVAQRHMGKLFAGANRILMNTPEATRAAKERFPFLSDDRIHCLTNGYDAEDFVGLAPRKPDGKFRILHAGYLHTQVGFAHRLRGPLKKLLGGELWAADFLPRSHYFLLEAIDRLEREKPGSTENIEIVLAGQLSDADEDVVRWFEIGEKVRMPGYLDHKSTVKAMVEADLLFLPLHEVPPTKRARIVPGKTYEYLASGRPILAAVPEGDTRDFVLAANAGRVVTPTDVSGIARAIEAFLSEAPTALRQLDEATLRFERQLLTRQLADHFRALLDVERKGHGAALEKAEVLGPS